MSYTGNFWWLRHCGSWLKKSKASFSQRTNKYRSVKNFVRLIFIKRQKSHLAPAYHPNFNLIATDIVLRSTLLLLNCEKIEEAGANVRPKNLETTFRWFLIPEEACELKANLCMNNWACKFATRLSGSLHHFNLEIYTGVNLWRFGIQKWFLQ